MAATCGEVLVELLEAHGIDTVFGIPGVHTVELYRGLPATRIRHVTPRHEQGAGFMADGYARASARVAACFIITGPGMTNIATALGQAQADSVPMLVVSSVNQTHELALGEGRLHELPSQRNLIAGLTAFSHTLLRADELPAVLARAFTTFAAARPQPVHLELPLDVITAAADHLPRTAMAPAVRPGPDPRAVARAAALLAEAKRPLVVLGGGAQDATAPARELVKRLGAPALTTINGKGILAPDDPLNAGGSLAVAPVLEELAAADVVLAVGTELGETDTLLFGQSLALAGRVIRIDIDHAQLARNAIPEVAMPCDAGLALEALSGEIGAGAGAESGGARAARLRERIDASLDHAQRMHRRVMQTVTKALPNAIVVGDSTQLVYSANIFHQPERPRSYFNSSTGYGTLGYALPAALGAKLAEPSRPVLAVIGDGGLLFTIGELATAVELELPVAILLWNNRGYGEIKKYMLERAIPAIGVDIYTPDLLAIARGFGCHTARAESLDALERLLAETPRAGGPTVIEVDEATAMSW